MFHTGAIQEQLSLEDKLSTVDGTADQLLTFFESHAEATPNPKHYDPDNSDRHEDIMVDRLWTRLGDSVTKRIIHFLDTITGKRGSLPNGISVGTGCSGTDCPLLALAALQRHLKTHHSFALKIRHEWSVDNEQHCRIFESRLARHMGQNPRIFTNLSVLAKTPPQTAVNWNEEHLPIASVVDCWLVVIGFPCVDLSSMNPKCAALRCFRIPDAR